MRKIGCLLLLLLACALALHAQDRTYLINLVVPDEVEEVGQCLTFLYLLCTTYLFGELLDDLVPILFE